MRLRILFALGLLAVLAPLSGLAQSSAPAAAPAASSPDAAPSTTDRIQVRSYTFQEAGGIPMEYQLYVPTSYDPAVPHPLIVLLHGLGSNPGQVIRYQGLTDLAEERGYIVVAPMGYNSRGWYGSRGTGRSSERGDAANDPENLGELSETDVMNVLEITRGELNVDPSRIYLAGHSMGGGGTWHIAIKYPDLWAALGPVAPAIYTSPDALEAIRHIPVIVIQGDADNLVSTEVTRSWVAKMGELGMEHRYIEIPGGDHTAIITRTPENVRAIFDFFDQARKD
jgi:poly(3-hydroxybutyrate) depolymerase